ncbi:MAG TPA: class I adenylate-forming enzyme family protein, partial [Microthrixaceae bacterium]|nr:class I adenylate-forming enzyme family protein [Microthrixaceae bacterium]
MLSYDEAARQVTAAGMPFETVQQDVMGVPRTLFRNAPNSLRDIVVAASARSDDVTFLVYEDERWGFERFGREVSALGTALVEQYGIGRGDRVAIAMRNYPEWVVSFAAAVSIGAISVSFNAWWTAEEMDFALSDCGASVLIADAERIERSRATCERLGVPTLAVRAPDAAALGTTAAPVAQWSDVVGARATDPTVALPDVAIDPDDDATILYTSGTTGNPKGAVSTHRAVVQALMGYACRSALDKARDPDRQGGLAAPSFILVVPLFHVTGCVPVMLSCMLGGLKLVMVYRWDPERALQLIEREEISNFVGVPTQNFDMLNCEAFERYDTSSLRSVGGGGAPAPPELVQRIATTYAKAAPGIGYGMTETNAYGPQNGGADYLTHPTSAGRTTPIMAVEIRDPSGVPVPVGEVGEIWFNGPNLIRGYWNRPDATAEATWTDPQGRPWLRTGDIGRVDEEGFLYVVDRKKDMILSGGQNVYPADVEAILFEHPGVAQCAVVGAPSRKWGETPVAFVVPAEDSGLAAPDLRDWLNARLARFQKVAAVHLVDDLPRNATGKVLKRELRAGLVPL